jgi:hypothetical protein
MSTFVSGSATILANTYFVDVAHGLLSTPSINDITLTPQDDLGGRQVWPGNVGPITFRINISDADPLLNHVISYTIKVPAAPGPPTPEFYVTVSEVQAALNASHDESGETYTVFGLLVMGFSFDAHVDFANLYVYAIVGSLLEMTDQRYNWAKMAALDLACLRILVAASGGMLVGAFDYHLGDLGAGKSSIGRLAFENAIQGFREDLLRVLMNFAKPVVAAEASAKEDVPTYRGGLINP